MKLLRKKIILPVIFLALIVAGIWYAYHLKNGKKPSVAPGSSYVPAASTAVSTSDVKIENYTYSPADIQVKLGTTVTWTNNDFVAYTVTEDDSQAGPASGPIKQNQTFSYKFTAPGLYHYHNSFDPQMNGTVTVSQ